MYEPQGKLHFGLTRYNLVVGLQLPYQWNRRTPWKTVSDLKQAYTAFCDQVRSNKVAAKACKDLEVVVEYYLEQESYHHRLIQQLFRYDVPAMLPHVTDISEHRGWADTNLAKDIPTDSRDRQVPTVTTRRTRTGRAITRRNQRQNLRGTTPMPYAEVHNFFRNLPTINTDTTTAPSRNTRDFRMISDPTNQKMKILNETTTQEPVTRPNRPRRRHKRWAMEIAGLVMDGVGRFLAWRKDEMMFKGMEALHQRQNRLEGSIVQIENNLLSVTRTVMKGFDNLYKNVQFHTNQILRLTTTLTSQTIQIDNLEADFRTTTDIVTFVLGQLKVHFDKNIDYFLEIERMGNSLLTALDGLSTGHLNHEVISPYMLQVYLDHITQVMKELHPSYELAMENIHEYYDVDFVTYVVDQGILYIHLPVYFKNTANEELNLYKVHSVPIPFDPATLKPNAEGRFVGDYTHVKLSKTYLALGQADYLELTDDDLLRCSHVHSRYYCETTMLVQKMTDYTCTSAIFFNLTTLAGDLCDVRYLVNYDPIPTIWTVQDWILLIGMPAPWRAFCSADTDIPIALNEGSLVLIKQEDLCHCTWCSGTYCLQENPMYCELQNLHNKAELLLYKTINTAVVEALDTAIDGITTMNDRMRIQIQTETKDIQNRYIPQNQTVDLDGNIILAQNWNQRVPSATIIQEDPTDFAILQTNLEIDAPLENVIDAIKTRQQTYGTKGDYQMFSAKIQNWLSAEKWLVIFTFGAACVGIVACIVGVWIIIKWKKVRLMYSGINKTTSKLLASGVTLSQLQGSHAMSVTLGKTTNDGTNILDTLIMRYEPMDMAVWIGMYFCCVIMLFSIFKTYQWILQHQKIYVNQKKHCNSLACRGWTDQTDIYLQIASKTCMSSIKFYLGTLLGQPKEIVVNGRLSIANLEYSRGLLTDKITILWQQNHLICDGDQFFLTGTLTVGLLKRFLARHLFQMNGLSCDLTFVYNGQLVVKSVKLINDHTNSISANMAQSDVEKIANITESVNLAMMYDEKVMNETSEKDKTGTSLHRQSSVRKSKRSNKDLTPSAPPDESVNTTLYRTTGPMFHSNRSTCLHCNTTQFM